jgi:hypothetical protein
MSSFSAFDSKGGEFYGPKKTKVIEYQKTPILNFLCFQVVILLVLVPNKKYVDHEVRGGLIP